jgi:hypothetical protein
MFLSIGNYVAIGLMIAGMPLIVPGGLLLLARAWVSNN